ncbi:MAG: hypothetical protein CM1200mP14_25530 [Gammaproteobacteria bacterium]|nr:MAG: hypothetical protein CM1200mP14_25530 [Gammaproteobacteria bacterium]
MGRSSYWWRCDDRLLQCRGTVNLCLGNMVQLAVLLLGFAIGVPSLCRLQVGGRSCSSSTHTRILGFLVGTWIRYILVALIFPAFIISPGLLQKAYGASSERSRIGIGIQGLVLLVFAMAPPLLGMIARVTSLIWKK